MATYPTSLSNAFEYKVKPVASIIDSDIKERALRQAVREMSVHLPDIRTFDEVGDGTKRPAMSSKLRAAIFALGGRPLERLLGIENPVDLDPPQDWEDDDWDIAPRTMMCLIHPTSPTTWVLKERVVPAAEAFRVTAEVAHDYQLPTPDAPTITGTAGANAWVYKVAARDSAGVTAASSATTFNSAAATLAALAGDPHTLTWPMVPYATSYDVYLTSAPGGSGATTGKIANTTALTLVHDTENGDAAAAPSTNTTETTLPEPARDPTAARGGSIALDAVMSYNVTSTGDGTGGAPIEWGEVIDNAAKLKAVLDAEFAMFVKKIVPGLKEAGGGGAGSVRATVAFQNFQPDAVYGEPVLSLYRDRSRRA